LKVEMPDSVFPRVRVSPEVAGAEPIPASPVPMPTNDANIEPFDQDEFDKLVTLINSRDCILFLGAGVHYPPPSDSRYNYPEEQRPPLAGALAESLAAKCSFAETCPGESNRNLPRVALCYEHRHRRRQLIEEIRLAVDDHTEPSPVIRALAELPFPLVMTTNYDRLFERALQRLPEEKRPEVEIYNPERFRRPRDYRRATAERPFVFKVHGDVSASESIVVTDEDYITFVMRMNEPEGTHPIPQTFRYQLNNLATLFVGYGLLDFNLRLLFRTMHWKLDDSERPETYSVDVHPDPLVSDEWKREHGLRFIVEDVWSFLPRLYRAVLGREMSP
jgi:hypothetical protein